MFFPRLVLPWLTAFSLASFAFGATRLPDQEVQALNDIAKALGKTNWNFTVDPCSGEEGWVTPNSTKDDINAVTCGPSCPNATSCHVVSIVLKKQNLQGTLPTNLSGLPYLQEFDVTRNYLNGTIPPRWGSTQLVNISLLGNRLTGPIPTELGNISTLKSLTVEFNRLSGNLPAELGNLSSIERLLLTSNNFTGSLPETFARLTTLTDFRIGDSNFTGQIPTFIQNWKSLSKLVIQGSGLSGPIPSGIALLENITDLRITDLNGGSESQFPHLENMKQLKYLMLRNCNIADPLPPYLGKMSKLKRLDLSFNKLTGEIPSTFDGLDTDFMYLTGNLLTGKVSDRILQTGKIVDLSYNNFTTTGTQCQEGEVNLFGSSAKGNVSDPISCLVNDVCPKDFYSFHINCGGPEAFLDGNTYEDDIDRAGPSNFYKSRTNWAFSSTGNFYDDHKTTDFYVLSSSNTTEKTADLYMNARLSPVSLTYYGFCLKNGNYTVRLHFAEIKFTDDNTYSSLGRRIFDIYIQGKLEQEDFNIEDEAGGVGKAIIKNFTAIVTDGALEIRFYWAGKGTTAIPDRGVYGPLVSAISVTSDSMPPSENGNSISVGTVVAIVAAVTAVIILVLGVLWRKGCLRHGMDQDLKGLDLHTASFTLRQIKAATNNFDSANKIGEGGFGPVYKGLLSDGTIIAVKQLSSKSKQGNREFLNEIGMISALQHPHLVKLYGCCIEGNQLLVVYEYMENNSLARALFGPEEHQLMLDWPTRQKICVGIARGLAYLHEESRLKIVHRDIKATNVLLDKNLNPKISDFGLAKLDDEENTHISTRIAGTLGYMAPEYAMRGYLTDKADVYSFGIVALEIVSGRSNTVHRTKAQSFNLLDWAVELKQTGKPLELVDPRLGTNYNEKEVMAMINVALLCTNPTAAIRPTMSVVTSILEGKAIDVVQDSNVVLSEEEEMKIEEETRGQQFQHGMQPSIISKSQTQSLLSEVPWTGSSSSDLYPLRLSSDKWDRRD